VVESLADEFDMLQIASVAVKMALEAGIGGGGAEQEKDIPPVKLKDERPSVPARRAEAAFAPRASGPENRKPPREWSEERPRKEGKPVPRHDRAAPGTLTRLFVGAGRVAGVRPGDLVGAITGEAGVESRVIGSIEIADHFSIVEVPKTLANDIITALRATKIRGRKVTVNRDRGAKG
jgi:ATP-dependent RNA helicase DeaD